MPRAGANSYAPFMSTHIESRPGIEATAVQAGWVALLLIVGVIVGFVLAGWGTSLEARPFPTPRPNPLPTASVQPGVGR